MMKFTVLKVFTSLILTALMLSVFVSCNSDGGDTSTNAPTLSDSVQSPSVFTYHPDDASDSYSASNLDSGTDIGSAYSSDDTQASASLSASISAGTTRTESTSAKLTSPAGSTKATSSPEQSATVGSTATSPTITRAASTTRNPTTTTTRPTTTRRPTTTTTRPTTTRRPTTTTTRPTTATTRPTTTRRPTTTTTRPTTTRRPTTTAKPTTTAPYVVDTITESSSVNSVANYSVGKTITTYTKYNIYNNGSRKEIRSWDEVEYDHSSYSATTDDLLVEANDNRNLYSDYINSVFTQVNAYRAEVGAAPLTLNEELCTAACVRSTEMAWSGVFSHTRPNGTRCYTVLTELDYFGSGYNGENIATGQSSPESVCNSWRNSPGHYSNMTKAVYSQIGIGVAKSPEGRLYWTQIFEG